MKKCSLCGKQIDPEKETSTELTFSKYGKSFIYHSKCFKKLPGLMAMQEKK